MVKFQKNAKYKKKTDHVNIYAMKSTKKEKVKTVFHINSK